ncbi:MAG: 30S ribosomal protein S6 [Nitrospirae bacterium]|nr:30S ribosomal protein S6 [Candidatus Troglogloeales bacterium]MBI3598967.1 30S ribosomal protein S6 [Candidatus Troglogloeales bacterium]
MESKQLYEIIFVIKSTITDDEVLKTVDKVRATVERENGEIILVENMGRKKLAYEVKKEKKGVYILIHFKGKGNVVFDVERTCRLEESIIKFITVKINPADLHATPPRLENAVPFIKEMKPSS